MADASYSYGRNDYRYGLMGYIGEKKPLGITQDEVDYGAANFPRETGH